MNRKFFVLAFVSAAFFFGCSADGYFPVGHPEQAVYNKDSSSSPGQFNPSPNPGSSSSPGSEVYCVTFISGVGGMCDSDTDYCAQMGGQVGSCPAGYTKY